MVSDRSGRLDLLDPHEVASLGGIELVARGVVEGFLAGLHRSPFRGFSVEFAEHRPYQPGDELRYLDWKVLGKRGGLWSVFAQHTAAEREKAGENASGTPP